MWMSMWAAGRSVVGSAINIIHARWCVENGATCSLIWATGVFPSARRCKALMRFGKRKAVDKCTPIGALVRGIEQVRPARSLD